MSTPLPSVLVVDDEKNMRRSLQTVLGDEGYAARAVESAEEGLELLGHEEFFMVITDARLGGMSGYDFLTQVRQQWPELPVLMLTAYATPKLAVEAIKAGAMDYLAKPFAPEELLHAVARCAERHRLLRENAALRLRAGEVFSLDQIVGESPKMRELRKLIQTVAPTDTRALILGESGTGKELVARALHAGSPRAQRPFVAINCAALTETLLESELFGHEKGAFTGAVSLKKGKLEMAEGGTVFLDEVAELPVELQPKLLRAIEAREVRRVGETRPRKVNVRVLSASNRQLEREVNRGRFREDLYFRLAVMTVRVPPLRERLDDLLILVRVFLQALGVPDEERLFTAAVLAEMGRHDWPGNVRELRNYVERSVVLQKASPALRSTSLAPGSGLPLIDIGIPFRVAKDEAVDAFERAYLSTLLEAAGNNMSKAARLAGMDRMYLHRLAQKHGLRGGGAAGASS